MANHTHDCEYCGQDRRLISRCCDESVADEKEKSRVAQERTELNKEICNTYNLKYFIDSNGRFHIYEDALDLILKASDSPTLQALAWEVKIKKEKSR